MSTVNVWQCRYQVLVALLALAGGTLGQLSFHNDPSQNSFSIKLPAFQQTFTRYFGNQPHGALLQQQQQLPNTLMQPSLIGSQAQAYQQRQQQQQQQPLYYQQQAQQQPQPDSLNRYVAQFPDQPHYTVQENYINPNIRLRQQQQRLLQQQMQQLNNYQGLGAQPAPTAQDASVYSAGNQPQPQSQYEYTQQPTGAEADLGQEQPVKGQQYQPVDGQRGHFQQQQHQGNSATDASTAAKLIGVAFSPSNEVSQVKFSSAGLKYNF
ncbi:probable basic-leucine zipper transcription factor Q [Anopheles nili]|uniref:probable basic-leucine zipper transcription factor Q n=1 Tax=Anopheles nili TaxID=185578 RepID=UPI00237BA648|nr:probable basic-leucine zipper transcription factor Q [Anopheles nili]